MPSTIRIPAAELSRSLDDSGDQLRKGGSGDREQADGNAVSAATWVAATGVVASQKQPNRTKNKLELYPHGNYHGQVHALEGRTDFPSPGIC